MALSLAALVLAGGQSSRMGRDKALIPWDGKPLLQRVCEVAATCCQSVSILSPWPERYRQIVSGDYQWLIESNPGQGPLMALAEGLALLEEDWVLLLGCDLPALQPEILGQWTYQLPDLPRNIMALVPRQGDLWEPLCGFYRRSGRSHLESFIQTGGRSFQAWLPEIPVQPLPVGSQEARMLLNCNTVEDLG